MQTDSERKAGMNRRQPGRLMPIPSQSARRWDDLAPALMAGGSDDVYDPYDAYWEPVSGQDDD